MAETPPDATTDEAERLYGLVRARYGHRLSESEFAELRKVVDGVLQAARALRAVKLANSDEPFQPFVPYRSDG